ncbi:thiol:disulfide interchange protein TlpA [Aurantimonas endophytica]|uniref:Thiol-disulfide isomerase/thioredoxin n=1 Tax=Aurantimonas endophytica TaxID=1522175 RepID=A0A7W6MS24_9HYPH|nr:TlpA disulfide reductase family protein [Aurantimonas endophytica]MBB4005685.1 thiol-disulfide isomerase/thioredoxin [Aurantimonas endophytica]MCO6406364.1 redoxin family protein [Aurantimonas endophytica]
MSDETPKASNGRRLGLVAAVALLCGVAAGGAVLYVSETGSGNEVADRCTVDEALSAALDQNARGEVAAVAPLDKPFDVSAIAFKDGDGNAASLADFAGSTVLVNLWATWCGPCREEMPALDALERDEGGEDFAVVPINVDMGDPQKPKDFYTETGLTALPFYRDETMGVFNDLKGQGVAFGLPISLVVGPDGCARAAINGPAEWASPDAVRLIDVVRQSAAPGV